MASVIAVRCRATIAFLPGDALRPEEVEVGRCAANVIVQRAVDIVIAGTVAVLNIVIVKDLEDAARLLELGGQTVVNNIPQLNGEDDVLIARVVDDPLKCL